MDWLASVYDSFPWPLAGGALAASLALAAAGLGLRRMLPGRSVVIERLERTVGRIEPSEHLAGKVEAGPSSYLRPVIWMVRPSRAEELSRLRQKLVQAGLRGPRALELFLAAKVLLAVALTVAFLQINARLQRQLVFPFDLGVAVWVCAAGFFLPHLWLRSRARARQILISNALPDAMDLTVTCVESGLGLDAAIARVAQEIGLAAPELGSELNLTFLEIQAGVPRADAFRRLAERTGVDDLRSLSAMLIQTEMFGTSVARALRVHGDGMRVRRMQQAEERAGMVGVKMTFPLVLCILPALIAVVMGPAVATIVETFVTKIQR
jgi:tight adherence protein C